MPVPVADSEAALSDHGEAAPVEEGVGLDQYTCWVLLNVGVEIELQVVG